MFSYFFSFISVIRLILIVLLLFPCFVYYYYICRVRRDHARLNTDNISELIVTSVKTKGFSGYIIIIRLPCLVML